MCRWRLILAGLAVLLATGCGGGSGDSAGGSALPGGGSGGSSSVAAPAMAVTATLGPEFTPRSLKVPIVSTLQDRQPLGSPVQVGEDQGGVIGVVFGHDEGGEVALAGYPDSGGRLVLSAESTVLALAGSALSVEFPHVPRAELFAGVRGNAGYAGVVQFLRQAIQSNRNGLLDDTFVRALQELIGQVATSLASVKIQGKALEGPKLTIEDLPVLVRGRSDLVPWYRGEVELHDQLPEFVFHNGTIVALEISQRNVAGVTTGIVVAGPEESVKLANARQSLSFQVIADIRRNSAISVLNALSAIFSPAVESCLGSVTTSLIGNEAVVELGANPGPGQLASVVSNLLGTDLAVALGECGITASVATGSSWLPIVKVVVLAHGLLKLGQHLKEWSYFLAPKAVAVCISDTGRMRNCVHEIRLKQPLPVLLPDDFIAGFLEYLDKKASLTVAHPDELEIKYIGSGPRLANLSELPGGGFLAAMEPGTQYIHVQDRTTNAWVELGIDVDQLDASTTPIRVRAGESVGVDLIGKRTRRAIKMPTTLTVSTQHPDIASAVRGGNRITVTGHRAGNTVLRVSSASSGKVLPLEVPITVADPEPTEIRFELDLDSRARRVKRWYCSSPECGSKLHLGYKHIYQIFSGTLTAPVGSITYPSYGAAGRLSRISCGAWSATTWTDHTGTLPACQRQEGAPSSTYITVESVSLADYIGVTVSNRWAYTRPFLDYPFEGPVQEMEVILSSIIRSDENPLAWF